MEVQDLLLLPCKSCARAVDQTYWTIYAAAGHTNFSVRFDSRCEFLNETSPGWDVGLTWHRQGGPSSVMTVTTYQSN